MPSLEQLSAILRRLPDCRFVREAKQMVLFGDMPDAELLQRCGIRLDSDSEIVN